MGEISLVDPYACAIHVEGKYFNFRKAAGHIPREISRYIYCFIKKEEGSITVKILSVKYRSSSIPSEGLEISLILKVNSSKSITFLNMKQFVNEHYEYEFTGKVKIEESEDEEIPTMVIDENKDTVDNKTKEKTETFLHNSFI